MELKSILALTEKKAVFEVIKALNGVHTVEDVQHTCNCSKPEVIKTILFVGRKPIVVLMTGDKKVDVEKLKTLRSDDSLRMANKSEVSDFTGYSVGTVSPFGLRGEMDIVADQNVQSLASLIMGSGKDDTLLKMKQADFAQAFHGTYHTLAL